MANDDDGQRWAKELVERVGKAIKEARGGKSAAWLSDRTAELGYRISPTVIAKLDSGHRGSVLSVPELIVLAAALNTSPVTLVYPGPYERDVDLLPDIATSEFYAAQWFSGLGYWWVIAGEDDEAWRTAGRAWIDSLRPLRAHRRLQETEMMRAQLVERGGYDKDRDQIAFYDRLIEQLREEIGPDRDSDA